MSANPEILFEGWCGKLSTRYKSYRRNWFVLTRTLISYYKRPGGKLVDTIDITTGDVELDFSNPKQPSFKIIHPNKTYRIVCNTTEEANQWFEHIQRARSEEVPQDTRVGLADFTTLKVIGRGSYGKVRLVRHNASGQVYAMKSLSKKKLADFNLVEKTKTERNVLITAQHPFLVSAKYTFQDDVKVYMVLEYVPGGELYRRLKAEGRFREQRVKYYAAQLVLAISYLHSLGIIHRDLKPENVLMAEDGYIKLADFGLVKDNMEPLSETQTFCGTPEYISPEICEGRKYNMSVDWWSLGILIYEMLFGSPPFFDTNVNVTYRKIIMDDIQFPADASPEAKSLIEGLCDKDPECRLGAGENGREMVMAHPFFRDIDWDALLAKKIEMEWKPSISGDTDVEQFDQMFTTENPEISYEDPSVIPDETNFLLKGFTFTDDSVI